MFHFYLAVLWVLVTWRIVWPLPLRQSWKIAIAVALLCFAEHHLLGRLVFGTMFSPEVPAALIAVAGWGFVALLLLAVQAILLEVVMLPLRLTGKTPGMQRQTTLRMAAVGIAALLSAIGVHQGARVPEVKRVELPVAGLPTTLDGYRVVQLSDLHISRMLSASWAQAVVERTNALQADLIVVTGDVIDGTVQARAADVAPLGALRARHGVIAIPGNHEYYFNEPQWTAKFRQLGMRVLVNAHEAIGTPGAAFIVAGIADDAALRYGQPGPDLAAALRGAPGGQPIVLLNHRPSNVVAHAQSGIAVQLSGHTHGGMIRGMDAIVRYANGGYVSGRYEVQGMQLYVNNGTGIWNGFPVRLGVPAEITEFVLRARPAP